MNAKIIITLIFGYLCTTRIHAQDVLFIQEGELTIAGETAMYIEGGIVLENAGMINHEGQIHLGTSGSGYQPLDANWTQNDASQIYGNDGKVLFTGKGFEHRIGGNGIIKIGQLHILNSTILDHSLQVNQLTIGSTNLFLNGQELIINSPASQALTHNERIGGIVSETHIQRDGGYGRVRWDLQGAVADSLFSIPFSTVNEVPIPIKFRLAEIGTDTLNIATYSTNPDNTPYPVGVGFMRDVAHMRGPNGEDISSTFLDRFWLVNGEENVINYLSVSYDPEREVTEQVMGKEHLLRVQPWLSAKWIFFDLGDEINDNTIAWRESNILPNIYSASLASEIAVSSIPNLTQDNRNRIEVFPNPGNGLFNISAEYENPQSVKVTVFDLKGKSLFRSDRPPHSLKDQYSIDLRSYPNGMYFMYVQLHGHRLSYRLIKQ